MLTARDVAQHVVRKNWPIMASGFDALWSSVTDVPVRTAPLTEGRLVVPSLTAVSRLEPVAIAMVILLQACTP